MAKMQLSSCEKVSRSIIILFILIYPVFMLSCGIKMGVQSKIGPAKTLKKNVLALDQEHGFTALAVWSLRIEDRTGYLKGMKPKFLIGPVGAAERLCKYLKSGNKVHLLEVTPKEYVSSFASVKPINGSWTEKNGQAIYDALFAAELRPGEHQIFQLFLESKNAYRERLVNIPLNATFSIVQDKVYDLKLLEIIFSERVKVKGRKEEFYSYSIHAPPMEMSNKEKLSQLHPALTLPLNSVVSKYSFIVPFCNKQ